LSFCSKSPCGGFSDTTFVNSFLAKKNHVDSFRYDGEHDGGKNRKAMSEFLKPGIARLDGFIKKM
jgi:hypothetical protein